MLRLGDEQSIKGVLVERRQRRKGRQMFGGYGQNAPRRAVEDQVQHLAETGAQEELPSLMLEDNFPNADNAHDKRCCGAGHCPPGPRRDLVAGRNGPDQNVGVKQADCRERLELWEFLTIAAAG